MAAPTSIGRLSTSHSSSARHLYCGWLYLYVVLLLTATSGRIYAQQDPFGASGAYGGLVTTAGAYDAYYGNAQRTVPDLVVPGSNGAYPLAFTRVANSRLNAVGWDGPYLGDCGNWRHSYQWVVSERYNDTTVTPTRTTYTVAYPDGRVTKFYQGNGAPPAGETYLRGPSSTSDRLEIIGSDAGLRLHLSDGGIVVFSLYNQTSNPYIWAATAIIDPYGAVTRLSYTQTTGGFYLNTVTEPGGRVLTINYSTVNYSDSKNKNHIWNVISSVTSTDAKSSNTPTLTFHYPSTPVQYTLGSGSNAQNLYYLPLTSVTYNEETSAGGGAVTAYYNYYYATTDINTNTPELPLLIQCDDPHYTGAMTRIQYNYNISGSTVWGVLNAEQNYPRPGSGTATYNVSTLTQNQVGAPTLASDTRGDYADSSHKHTIESFQYGQANTTTAGGKSYATCAESYQPTTLVDFEGQSTLIYYTAVSPGQPGRGYVSAVCDANGYMTGYTTEPFVGKVTLTTLPDGRKRQTVWGSLDGTMKTDGSGSANPCTMPYYVYQTKDERGTTATYTLHASGMPSKIVYSDSSQQFISQESYTYKSITVGGVTFYKVGTYTNKLGAVFTYNYDESGGGGSGCKGLLTSVNRSYSEKSDGTGAMHSETSRFHYNAQDRLDQTWDQRNVSDSYTYNGRGQLLTVTHASQGTAYPVQYGYDDYGHRTSVQDERGAVTKTIYDDYGRPVNVIRPVDASHTRTTTYGYDRRDSSNAVIGDPMSHTSGAFSVMILNSGKTVQHVYFPTGRLKGNYLGMIWNGTDPQPGNGYAFDASITYDSVGNPTTVEDAQGYSWTKTYDSCNRLASVTDPLGHATTYDYYQTSSPYFGLPKKTVGPGPDTSLAPTATTSYNQYDAMGRLQSVQDAASHTFSSAYDPAGDLAAQSDGNDGTNGSPSNSQQKYKTDQLGRRANIGFPGDSTNETWTYDASGNVSTYTNRAGDVCTMQYDMRNRPTTTTWTLGAGSTQSQVSTRRWFFDDAGRLTEVYNDESDLTFTYDDSGLVLSETSRCNRYGPYTHTTSYARDADGNVAGMVYPNGDKPTWGYDDQNRCVGLGSASQWWSLLSFYGEWVTSRQLGNGLRTNYSYQSNGRINQVFHFHSNGSGQYVANVSQLNYGFAPDGRISWFNRTADDGTSHSSLENGNGDTFFYTADGRLAAAYHDYGNVSAGANNQGDSETGSCGRSTASTNPYDDEYTYDNAGNRLSAAQMGATKITYATNGQNQYGGSAYDHNGNTTNSAVNWAYVYDSENEMTKATASNGTVIKFGYDPLGRLAWQSTIVGPQTTQRTYWYAGSQRIEERAGSNDTSVAGDSSIYRYFFDSPQSDSIVFRQNSAGRLYYQYDLMGNTTHVSNDSGTVVEQYTYDAYGTPYIFTQGGAATPGGVTTCDNRYLYRGSSAYQWYAGPQMYYCRARFYLPVHGRFLQPDPVGQAGGLDIYTYCENDPVSGIDPYGLDPKITDLGEAPRVTITGREIQGNGLQIDNPSGGQSYDLEGNSYETVSSLEQSDWVKEVPQALDGVHYRHSRNSTRSRHLDGGGLYNDQVMDVFRAFAPGGTYHNAITTTSTASIVAANIVTSFVTPGFGAAPEAMGLVGSAVGGGSRALVPMADAAFSTGSIRTVAGYELAGNAALVGDTYSVNVWGLYATENSRGLFSLTNTLRAEASAVGASRISITGNAVMNEGLLNISAPAASRLGLTIRQINLTTILLQGGVP